MRVCNAYLAGIVLAIVTVTQSWAAANEPPDRRLAPLLPFVVPVYTATYYAGLCVLVDRAYMQPVGRQGTVAHYLEHIRDEVAAFLAPDDARSLLIRADELARAEAREHLVKFGAGRQVVDDTEVAKWCASYVAEIVAELVRQHDADHENNHVLFFTQIRKALETSP